MGNCAGNPKTNEGDEAPVPVSHEPTIEEVKVEQQEVKAEENADSDDKSLGTILTENGEAKEEEPKTEEVKAEAGEEKKAETEEAKPETKAAEN